MSRIVPLLLLTVREPVRRGGIKTKDGKASAVPFKEVMRYIGENKKTILTSQSDVPEVNISQGHIWPFAPNDGLAVTKIAKIIRNPVTARAGDVSSPSGSDMIGGVSSGCDIERHWSKPRRDRQAHPENYRSRS